MFPPHMPDTRDKVICFLVVFLLFIGLCDMALSWSTNLAEAHPNTTADGSGLPEHTGLWIERSYDATTNSDIGSVYVAGIVHNDTSHSYRYVQIRFNCYDESYNLLGQAFDNVLDLAPGGRWKFRALGVGMPGAHTIAEPTLSGY